MNQPLALLSSAAVPVAAGDFLVVELTPRSGSQPTVTVRTIAQDKAGNLVPSAETKTLAADGTTQKITISQTTGVLFYVSVDTQLAGVEGGELFATVYIQNGSVVNSINNLYLTSGYVATGSPLIYPAQGSGNVNSQWSPTITEAIADPAVGDPIFAILNSNKQTKLTGFKFRYLPDNGGAGSFVMIAFETDGQQRFRFSSRTSIAAGFAGSFYGVLGSELPADDTTNSIYYFPIPNELSGVLLTISVQALQPGAADQFDEIDAWYYSQTSF